MRNAILDGKFVALNDEGQQDFGLLLRGQGRLHYAAFDLLWMNRRDLPSFGDLVGIVAKQ